MSAPANEFQAMLYGVLTGDAGLQALVGTRIYDEPPSDKPKHPYISFGSTDRTTTDADCHDAQLHTLQVDVWSNTNSKKEVNEIMHVIRRLVHDTEPELPTHGLSEVRIELEQVIRDPADLFHGILQVSADIEDAS